MSASKPKEKMRSASSMTRTSSEVERSTFFSLSKIARSIYIGILTERTYNVTHLVVMLCEQTTFDLLAMLDIR